MKGGGVLMSYVACLCYLIFLLPPVGVGVCVYVLIDKKCKLTRFSPMADCTHIPLLSHSLDYVTALRARLWQ